MSKYIPKSQVLEFLSREEETEEQLPNSEEKPQEIDDDDGHHSRIASPLNKNIGAEKKSLEEDLLIKDTTEIDFLKSPADYPQSKKRISPLTDDNSAEYLSRKRLHVADKISISPLNSETWEFKKSASPPPPRCENYGTNDESQENDGDDNIGAERMSLERKQEVDSLMASFDYDDIILLRNLFGIDEDGGEQDKQIGEEIKNLNAGDGQVSNFEQCPQEELTRSMPDVNICSDLSFSGAQEEAQALKEKVDDGDDGKSTSCDDFLLNLPTWEFKKSASPPPLSCENSGTNDE